MDFKLAVQLQIPITPLSHQITVNALNGQELPRITHSTRVSPSSLLAITPKPSHFSSWTHHLHQWFWDTRGSLNTTPGLTGALTQFPHGVTTVMNLV